MTADAHWNDDDKVVALTPPVERPTIPDFEGKNVAQTKAKISSVAALEIDDQTWRVDDFIRMQIEGRVIAVDHKVDEKTGHLVRVHTVKAVDCTLLPWGDE